LNNETKLAIVIWYLVEFTVYMHHSYCIKHSSWLTLCHFELRQSCNFTKNAHCSDCGVLYSG